MLVPIDDLSTMFYWIAVASRPAKGITQEGWRRFCAAEVGVDLDGELPQGAEIIRNGYQQDRDAMRRGDWTGIKGYSRSGYGDVGVDGADQPTAAKETRRLQRSRGRSIQAHDGRGGKEIPGGWTGDRHYGAARRAREPRFVRGRGFKSYGLANAWRSRGRACHVEVADAMEETHATDRACIGDAVRDNRCGGAGVADEAGATDFPVSAGRRHRTSSHATSSPA
jgi:hypothetical protein